MNFQEPISGLVERIARALERLAPPSPRRPDFDRAEAFIWQAEPEAFLPVATVNRVPLILLKGIDRMREVLFDNTVRFAQGLPANNALLWGARGTGKSSLVKAVHAAVSREGSAPAGSLKLVEIHREDIGTLPRLPRASPRDQGQTLHPVLRRPVLRGARHLLQVAEGRARRRRRRKARACDLLRDLEPAASHAARDAGERALDRHQPIGGHRRDRVALRPVRAVDRLPQLQPG